MEQYAINTGSFDLLIVSSSMVVSGGADINLSAATQVSGTFVGIGRSLTQVTASFIEAGSNTTSSFAVTSSHAINALTASHALNALTSSHALNALTSSHALNALSASFSLFSNNSITSSYTTGSRSIIGILTSSVIIISAESSSQAPLANTFLQINGFNGNPTRITIDTNNSASSFGSSIRARRSQGTAQSASAVLSQDILLQIVADGASGATFTSNSIAIDFMAANNWNTSSTPTRMMFKTTPNGSTISNEIMRLTESGSLFIGNVTSSATLGVFGTISASLFSGSHFGTSSNATTASHAVNALTASFALNSAGGSGTTLFTGSTYQITSSWALFSLTSSMSLTSSNTVTFVLSASWASQSLSASITTNATTSDFALLAGTTISSSYATTSSFALVGPFTTLSTASTYQITSSTAVTSSFATTASWAIDTLSSSLETSARITADDLLSNTISNTLSIARKATGSIAMLTASFTVSAGSMTVIPGLLIPMGVSVAYMFDAVLLFSTSINSPNIGFGMTFPGMVNAGGTILAGMSAVQQLNASTWDSNRLNCWNQAGSNSVLVSITMGATAANLPVVYTGMFFVSNATGTLQLAAKSSAGQALVLLAGSYLRLARIN